MYLANKDQTTDTNEQRRWQWRWMWEKKTGIANSKQHVIADGEMNGKSCVIICIPLCADIIIFKQHLAFTSTPNGPKWFKNEHLVLHMLQLFNALATLSRSISHSRIFSTGEKTQLWGPYSFKFHHHLPTKCARSHSLTNCVPFSNGECFKNVHRSIFTFFFCLLVIFAPFFPMRNLIVL